MVSGVRRPFTASSIQVSFNSCRLPWNAISAPPSLGRFRLGGWSGRNIQCPVQKVRTRFLFLKGEGIQYTHKKVILDNCHISYYKLLYTDTYNISTSSLLLLLHFHAHIFIFFFFIFTPTKKTGKFPCLVLRLWRGAAHLIPPITWC